MLIRTCCILSFTRLAPPHFVFCLITPGKWTVIILRANSSRVEFCKHRASRHNGQLRVWIIPHNLTSTVRGVSSVEDQAVSYWYTTRFQRVFVSLVLFLVLFLVFFFSFFFLLFFSDVGFAFKVAWTLFTPFDILDYFCLCFVIILFIEFFSLRFVGLFLIN